MLKRYYENTRHFECIKCKQEFTLGFWQWILTMFHNHITRHAYVKCPHCGEYHWRQAKKVK